ncbi:uncharacterized protein SCDLUD_002083 [Saccharomycodes ludwigii]|uniref:uncharacterized protein n=1 Tax=Saccharomycodes ludwigii TaxID=36035 RepID=UPI001E8931A6|nr:hypothetical protein SCDLUD_002083 [Saccharomycodes ludwigii]KAH3902266.1 hypothetical protein SCDLUD_002083 [Saccharomycodes ludwigii]
MVFITSNRASKITPKSSNKNNRDMNDSFVRDTVANTSLTVATDDGNKKTIKPHLKIGNSRQWFEQDEKRDTALLAIFQKQLNNRNRIIYRDALKEMIDHFDYPFKDQCTISQRWKYLSQKNKKTHLSISNVSNVALVGNYNINKEILEGEISTSSTENEQEGITESNGTQYRKKRYRKNGNNENNKNNRDISVFSNTLIKSKPRTDNIGEPPLPLRPPNKKHGSSELNSVETCGRQGTNLDCPTSVSTATNIIYNNNVNSDVFTAPTTPESITNNYREDTRDIPASKRRKLQDTVFLNNNNNNHEAAQSHNDDSDTDDKNDGYGAFDRDLAISFLNNSDVKRYFGCLVGEIVEEKFNKMFEELDERIIVLFNKVLKSEKSLHKKIDDLNCNVESKFGVDC